MNKIVAGTIAVTVSVLIVCVFTPVITNVGVIDFDWVYDDYRECGNDVSVTGVFEIVDYDGKHYIHANGVGSGSITDGDNTTNVTVKKAPLKVFYLIGQSNAMYYNADVDVANELPSVKTNAYYFGTEDSPIISWKDGNGNVYPNLSASTIHSMINPDGTFKIGNIESSFASKFSTNQHNYRCYVINGAVGGWGIQNFIPDTVGNTNLHNIWESAMAVVDDSLFDVSMGAVIMAQGESNTGTATDQYIEWFYELKDDLDLLTDMDLWLIIQTRYANGVNSSQAQKQIISSDPNVILGSDAPDGFTVDNGCLANDDIHYTQKGDNIVGVDVADAYIDHVMPSYNFDTIRPLLSVIPLLLIVAILMFTVGFVFYRKL